MKYFTLRKVALAHKAAWQKLRFAAGKGYYLIGVRPMRHGGEPKNQSPFTRIVQKLRPSPILMFDSITPSAIPANAPAVAGYVNGSWPTFGTLVSEWPAATHKVSIAVTANADADCLDVEQGDATIDQAAPWVRRQLARGAKRPILYTSVSQAPALQRALARAGISRSQIRLWTAHYTLKPHLCSAACGYGALQADATQFHNRYGGKNLDASLASPKFFA